MAGIRTGLVPMPRADRCLPGEFAPSRVAVLSCPSLPAIHVMLSPSMVWPARCVACQVEVGDGRTFEDDLKHTGFYWSGEAHSHRELTRADEQPPSLRARCAFCVFSGSRHSSVRLRGVRSFPRRDGFRVHDHYCWGSARPRTEQVSHARGGCASNTAWTGGDSVVRCCPPETTRCAPCRPGRRP